MQFLLPFQADELWMFWWGYINSIRILDLKNIHISSTHSHSSEEENYTKNCSKNCKCKRAFKISNVFFFKFFRIALVLFTYFIFCPHYLTESFSRFKLTSYRNKVLAEDSHCFQNITEVKFSNCFQHCLSNCSCTSFQMCESTCQLCAGGGLGIIRDKEGCSHFNFTADEEKVGSLTAPLAVSFLRHRA